MFVVSLVGQKGGTGKTTVALGLACAAATAGHTVAVIDLDPQATASKWKDRRAEGNPAVVSAQASRLKPALDVARANNADFVIIDSAGRSDDSALAAARAAGLILIPTRTSIVEIETLPAVNDLLRLADGIGRAFIVLNGLHPSAGAAGIEDARQMVRALYGLASYPRHLCQRTAYSDAMLTGTTPQERDPEGKAGQELGQLFEFVNEQAKLRSGDQEKSGSGDQAMLQASDQAKLPTDDQEELETAELVN
jgi:chromosome partitioning protein